MAKTLRNGQKCCALDSNGRKCSRPATHFESYRGEYSLYGYPSGFPTWVRITLCEKHRITPRERAQ
jgi:hypothetical protein